jgi:D-alanyl-D-alanine carboxypeptidase
MHRLSTKCAYVIICLLTMFTVPVPSVMAGVGTTSQPCTTIEGFCSTVAPLSEAQKTAMTPSAWRKGCPVALGDLRAVTVSYKTFGGFEAIGLLVVHRSVANKVVQAFHDLYDAEFPIESITPIEAFDGDDDRSTLANNTSGFNCRPVQGTKRFSQHAYGLAIDINPLQNPYVRPNGTVLDPKAQRFLDRVKTANEPGVISNKGAVVTAFKRIGWGWGGAWRVKDYQHVSSNNR